MYFLLKVSQLVTILFQRPWNPATSSLNQQKLRKLPGNPILVLTPSGPSDFWCRCYKTFFSSLICRQNKPVFVFGKILLLYNTCKAEIPTVSRTQKYCGRQKKYCQNKHCSLFFRQCQQRRKMLYNIYIRTISSLRLRHWRSMISNLVTLALSSFPYFIYSLKRVNVICLVGIDKPS